MPGNEGPAGEFDLIARIRRSTQNGPLTRIGIGDDCASLAWPAPSELLITTDMLMEGRHFRLEEASPEAVGYKALAVNLSDIAAMAGIPLAAVVAVALPRSSASEMAAGLQRGIAELAARYHVDLVGGDTNGWDGPLVISITLIGRATAKGPVPRSGAQVGDGVFVTGPLGGSLLSRHLRPTPRISEALAIHDRFPIRAMIDLSDGLASDLGHILEESGGLGAVLDPSAIPIHPDAIEQSRRDGRSTIEHALGDGEDFELCLTLRAEDCLVAEKFDLESVRLIRVGEIISEPGLFVRESDGSRTRWLGKGFDHLRS